MQSIKRALRFIGGSFSLALKFPQLQEPWFTLGVGSLAILFVWFLPIGLAAGLLGLAPSGLALIGLLAVFTLVALLLWGEIVALLTSRAMATIAGEPLSKTIPNRKILSSHGGAVIQLALAAPVFRLAQIFISKSSPAYERSLWFRVHSLALPVIAAEGLSLSETLDRLRQIVRGKFLPIQEKLVPVRFVAGVIQLILMATGVFLAFWVGLKLAGPQVINPWQRVMAAGIAMLVAWAPTFIGILLSSFTRTCYATALYQWTRNVETARSTGEADKAQPPDILRQVLGTGQIPKKDN